MMSRLGERLQPAAALAIRLWVAWEVWSSALGMLQQMQFTSLFTAARLGVPEAVGEFVTLGFTGALALLAALLAIGLAARTAALLLLLLIGAYSLLPSLDIAQLMINARWAVMLAVPLAFGAGGWSMDHVIGHFRRRRPPQTSATPEPANA
jgi:uncharacterized membrane protein YphA (DoxX/SURF4 family)